MSKKISNTKLFLILVALLALYGLSRYIDGKRGANTFHTVLIKHFDSAKVASVYIYAKEGKGQPIKLFVKNGKWMAGEGDVASLAEERSANYIIEQLQQIAPDRLASNDPSQWQHYLVTDTSGTRIVMLGKDNDTLLDVIVGRFGFMAQQRQGISYVRLNGEKEVYGVPGFLAMNISKDFDSWRDRKIIFPEYQSYTSLTYTYPNDSGFTVKKDSSGSWVFENGKKTDSAGANKTLSTLCHQNYGFFVNKFDTGANPALFTIKITAIANGTVVLKAYPAAASDTVNKYVITSSLDPGSYFSGAKGNLFKNIFSDRNSYLHHQETKNSNLAAQAKKKR